MGLGESLPWAGARGTCKFGAHLDRNRTAPSPLSADPLYPHLPPSYGANVNQDLIMGIMKGMTSRRNMVDGKPTSLLDLGYITVGLDDNWQDCGKYGPNGFSYHDASGNPIVNLGRFRDMKNMTDYAHSLGLRAGWYGNNC